MDHFDATPITVVIPTAARRPTLGAAIASALNQEPAPRRVLIVDDSVELGARTVVSEINNQRVEWLPNRRSHGPAGARNTGLERAATPIVAFLDDDDRYEPGFVAESLVTWNKSPRDTIAVWTAILEEYDNGVVMRRQVWAPTGGTAMERFVNSVMFNAFGTGHGLTVSRERFLALGGFNENLRVAEDTEALFRILLKGSVSTIDKCLVRVRRYGGDRLRDKAEQYANAMDTLKDQHAARLTASPAAMHALERSRLRWHMLAGHQNEGRNILSNLLGFGPPAMRMKALAMYAILLCGRDPASIRAEGYRKGP